VGIAAAARPDVTNTATTLVQRSVTGRRWVVPDVCDRAISALSLAHDVPEAVARVLAARGIACDTAGQFLAPRLRHCLPDPNGLAGMEEGAERLVHAIQRGERITVFADYDVDGATSSALLLRFLAAVGCPAQLYVPDRLREGYGPNAAALLRLRAAGTTLVITVDCGSSATEALAAAAAAGLDVVVVDHHPCPETLPPTVAVINPRRVDDRSGQGSLAAVGVTFLLLIATNQRLRAAGWYRGTVCEPDLLRWLDLVALGTVCDMVPLSGVNRALVAQGLKVLRGLANPGLRALAAVAGINRPLQLEDLSFALGPRVNAGGRVGAADLGARLLASDDAEEAAELARRLNAFNRERQQIEQQVTREALAKAAAEGTDLGPLLLVAGEGWHPGVIGIVASRLVEQTRKPALVLAVDGERAVGSGRSVPGIDLGAAVCKADAAGLILKGGGHAMACGLTVAAARLPELARFLAAALFRADAGSSAIPTLLLEGSLSLGGVTAQFAEALNALGPFGAGNPEPRFVVTAAPVRRVVPVGSQHLRVTLGHDDGEPPIAAMAFRAVGQPLGQALSEAEGNRLHLAGRLRRDLRRPDGAASLLIDDAAWTF
jgi:single-stranded-DNA-specific exonuclease